MGSFNPYPRQKSARHLPSGVIKRSIVVAGRSTSVSLEDAFWGSLKEIARNRNMTLADIIGHINGQRDHGNLSSSIRLFVLENTRAQQDTAANAASVQPGVVNSGFPC